METAATSAHADKRRVTRIHQTASRFTATAAVLLLCSAVVSGCSSKQRRSDGLPIPGSADAGQHANTGTMGPPEPFGPLPTVPQAPQNPYGPDPVLVKSVVLVLGPGAAHGFAHAGVLRALSDAKIPVSAIVGTEMGALIGAMYGSFSSINGFEWEIQKLKEGLFLDRPSMLSFNSSNSISDGKKFEEFLGQTFNLKDLKDARVATRISIREAGTDRVALLDRGRLNLALRGAMAIPGVFDPSPWGNKRVQSGTSVRPFPVSEAKALNRGIVVVVDVIGAARTQAHDGQFEKEEQKIAEQMDLAKRSGMSELQAADLVIEPDMKGIAFLDFGKRSESVFRGKAATQAVLQRLRALLGLPTETAAPGQDATIGAAAQ